MKIIKIGIIGYGRIAQTHISAIHKLNEIQDHFKVVLHSCLSTHPDRVQGFKKVTNDEIEFFSDPELMVVDICTPNFRHVHEIELAKKYNKAIYCEKPVVSNLHEAKRFGFLENSGVALVYRYNEGVSLLKDAIDQNLLGKLIHYKAIIYHDSYVSGNRLMTWRQTKAKAYGGASLDLGIHSVDLAHYLLGEIDDQKSMMNQLHHQRYVDEDHTVTQVNDTDEYMALLLRHQHVIGVIESSRVSKKLVKENTFELYTEKGTVVIKDESVIFYSHASKKTQELKIQPSLRTQLIHDLNQKMTDLDLFTRMHGTALYFFLMSLLFEHYKEYVCTISQALQSQQIIQNVLQEEVYA